MDEFASQLLREDGHELFERLWARIYPYSDRGDAVRMIAHNRGGARGLVWTSEGPSPSPPPATEGDGIRGRPPATIGDQANENRREAMRYARQLGLDRVGAWLDQQGADFFFENRTGSHVLNGLQKIDALVVAMGGKDYGFPPWQALVESRRNRCDAAQFASYVLYQLLYECRKQGLDAQCIPVSARQLAVYLNQRLFDGREVARALDESDFNREYHELPATALGPDRRIRPLTLLIRDSDTDLTRLARCEPVTQPC